MSDQRSIQLANIQHALCVSDVAMTIHNTACRQSAEKCSWIITEVVLVLTEWLSRV